MFANLDQPVKRFPVNQRLKIGADMNIGAGFAGGRVPRDPDRVVRPGQNPVADIGYKVQPGGRGVKIHRNKRGVIDGNTDLFHRGDKEIGVPLALDDAGEQLDQFDPANRCAQIEPCPVAGDPHVDIATKRRVPQMHGGRPFFANCAN